MKNIKTYKDMIKEMSLIDKEIKKFSNLEKISDSKILLKKINIHLEKIKNLLKKLKSEEIEFIFSEKNGNSKVYNISWNTKIDTQLFKLKQLFKRIKDENIPIKLKLETQKLFIDELEVQIEDNFNFIHFPIELPDFYKNIGIGIKIFLKAIDEFGYITSNLIEASFEAQLVFDHLFRNDEVYTITKNNSGLLFISKNIDIQKIEDIVKKYIDGVDKDNYAIDKHLNL